MLLDYRYLFVAWSDNLLVFSCEDIACTGDTPIFATGNNPIVFVDNRTQDKKETEMTNVRWKVFCFHAQIPQEKQKQLHPCGKCFATLISAQQGIGYL